MLSICKCCSVPKDVSTQRRSLPIEVGHLNYINDYGVKGINNNYQCVFLMNTRKWLLTAPYACNYSQVGACKQAQKQTVRQQDGTGGGKKTHRGGSSVKWLVLITCLCLHGDYEYINQHACQLEASKPARMRDGAKWVERERKNKRKNKNTHSTGNKVEFFFFSFAASKQNYYASRGRKAETEE